MPTAISDLQLAPFSEYQICLWDTEYFRMVGFPLYCRYHFYNFISSTFYLGPISVFYKPKIGLDHLTHNKYLMLRKFPYNSSIVCF